MLFTAQIRRADLRMVRQQTQYAARHHPLGNLAQFFRDDHTLAKEKQNFRQGLQHYIGRVCS